MSFYFENYQSKTKKKGISVLEATAEVSCSADVAMLGANEIGVTC